MAPGNMSYNEWIKSTQTTRNSDWKFNVSFEKSTDTQSPPDFPSVSLFVEGAEAYAMGVTSVGSEAIQNAAKTTSELGMFAPCMVGTLESQFLKMQASVCRAKSVLDVGTFTGMSALAFSEGIKSTEGKVVTLEADDSIADVAQKIFDEAGEIGQRIKLMRGSAKDSMKSLLQKGEKFDIIFLDADKENYGAYYDLAMEGLLSENGIILADNTLCALVYDGSDFRRQALHEFNQKVKNDPRVEQVVLTIREGITMIRKL